MLLTLLSARKEERIRQKASEENEEEEEEEEDDDNIFVVRDAATRENMRWFYVVIQSALFSLSEVEFFPTKMREEEEADAVYRSLSKLTPSELQKHNANSRRELNGQLELLSSLYESTALEFHEMEKVKEKLLANVQKLKDLNEEEDEDEDDEEIARLEKRLEEEKEKMRKMRGEGTTGGANERK